MKNSISENELKTRLKEDAHSLTPAFSENLHIQVMKHVRVARAVNMNQSSSDRRFPVLRWVAACAALICILLPTISILRQKSGEIDHLPPTASQSNPLQQMYGVVIGSAEPIRAKLELPMQSSKATYAALGADAKNLALFVTNQLPTFESERKSKPGM